MSGMLDLVCIICQEALDGTSDVYATLCGHIFNKSCISQWLRGSSTCPQCRKACTNGSIYKLYLDAAIESSENTGVQPNMSNSAIDLYEEINLNLKRDLELSESRLIDLEHQQAQVNSQLQEEIKRREAREKQVSELERERARLIELDQSLKEEYVRVQKDLRKEIEKRSNTNKEIEELRKDNLHLKMIVDRLQKERLQSHHPVTQRNIEERLSRIEKEIQAIDNLERSRTGQMSDVKDDIAAGAILNGVPQLPGENLKAIFHRLCEVINYTKPNIICISRTGQNNKNAGPITLQFASPNERNGILRALNTVQNRINRKLTLQDLNLGFTKNNKICMQETLTPQNRALLQQANRMKRNHQLASVYVNNGAVYVKENGNQQGKIIRHIGMLNAIVS